MTHSEIALSVLNFHCLKWPMLELPAVLDAFSETPAKSFLEIGTFFGATSAAVALAFPEARIVTVDLPDPTVLALNAHTATKTGLAHRKLGLTSRIEQILCDSKDLVVEGTFDLIFVDGDHSTEGVLADLRIASRLLTPNGVIVVHDYTSPDSEDRPGWTVEVERAVTAFAAESGFRTEKMPGWLVKLRPPA